MKRISKLIVHILGILAMLTPISCNFLEIPSPKDHLVQENVYTSDRSAGAVVSGIYAALIGGGYLDQLQIAAELNADNLMYGSNDQHYAQFLQSNVGEENSLINNIWGGFYKTIYQCNAALEGLRQSTGVTDVVNRQLRGELLTIRAFCYHYLTAFWGDVPLVTGTDYAVNQKIRRISKDEIRERIRSDLDEAKGLLSDEYPAADRTRVNRKAAQALLARMELEAGNWNGAESESTSIIESPSYAMAALDEAFAKSSNETIWQLMPNGRPAQFPTYVPGTADIIPIYHLNEDWALGMEEMDARRRAWTGINVVDGTDYRYPLKYRLASAAENTPPLECMVMMRLSEMYLVRAEARARLGNLDGAMADVRTVRERAGLDGVPTGTEDEVLSAIMQERKHELFTEWGDRWLSLKRRGEAERVLAPIKDGNWQPTDLLWPIPATEMKRNPFLVQNPGY